MHIYAYNIYAYIYLAESSMLEASNGSEYASILGNFETILLSFSFVFKPLFNYM